MINNNGVFSSKNQNLFIINSLINKTYAFNYTYLVENLSYNICQIEEDDILLMIQIKDKTLMPINIDYMIVRKDSMEVICIVKSHNNGYGNQDIENNFINYESYTYYDGIQVCVFNENNRWYISSRDSINGKINVCHNKTLINIFNECCEGVLTMEELNINNYYIFTLLHHRTKNIIPYTNYGCDYKKIIHQHTYNKKTNEEIYENINDKIIKNKRLYFTCYDEFITRLESINKINIQMKKITISGMEIRANGKKYKYETELFQRLKSLRGNKLNLNQTYMELYQKDVLLEYLEYVSNYGARIRNRITNAIKTISKEVLNIYHATRNKQNNELYNILPDTYKKLIYNIHGIFIENRKRNNNKYETYSISIQEVYLFLKQYDELIEIFSERIRLMNILNQSYKELYMVEYCIDTITQTKLMHQEIIF